MAERLSTWWLTQWQRVLQRVLYSWGAGKSLWVVLVFSVLAAAASSLWYSLATGFSMADASQQQYFQGDGFGYALASYTILFAILNFGATVIYVSGLALMLLWMGKWDYMPPLRYAVAWKLVLLTGMVPLVIVLVFGPMLQLPASMAAVLMLVHALWLRTLDIPEPDEAV